MQTSRFQLGLIATLAVGLGFSISSAEAVGYPAGTAVSMGSNPAWSTGGELEVPDTVLLVTAPVEYDAMVTDIYLSTNYATQRASLVFSDGTLAAKFRVRNEPGGDVVHSMTTGIRVPAGETLSLQWANSHKIIYNMSGYYAQP